MSAAWATKAPAAAAAAPAAAAPAATKAIAGGATVTRRKASFVADRSWIDVQVKAFTKWFNLKLRKADKEQLQLEDIFTDLADGTRLVELAACLNTKKNDDGSPERPLPKYNKTPKMRIHMLENLKVAFNYIQAEGVKMVNIGSEDIIDGNDKIILALIWSLINHYSLGDIELDGISGKQGLLLWCQRQTKSYDNVNVKNFSGSWKDGLAFCALLHRFGPDHIDYGSLTADDPAGNMELAFRVAEEVYGIERLIDPEDLLDCVRPDEKAIMTYLCEWFKVFAKFMKDEAQCAVIAQAIATTRRHDGWIAEYKESAAALTAALAAARERVSNTAEGAGGFGDTTAAVKDAFEAFYVELNEGKPVRKKQLHSTLSAHARLHSSQRSNDRTLFEAPAEITTDVLQAAWNALVAQEAAYEAAVRGAYKHFQQLDTQIERFLARAAKSKGFLAEQKALFDANDLGDSTIACNSLLDAYGAFEQQFDLHAKAVGGELRAAATENNIEVHAGAADVAAKLTELDELVAATRAAGQAYHDALKANLVEFEKRLELGRIGAWQERQQAIFAGEPPRTSAAVEHLIDDFQAGYTVEVVPIQARVDAVELNPDSPGAGVAGMLEQTKAAQVAVGEAAAAYSEGLQARKAELSDLNGKIKAYNKNATEFEVACDEFQRELRVEPVATSLVEAEAVIAKFDAETKPALAALQATDASISDAVEVIKASPEEEAASAFNRYDPASVQQWTVDCVAGCAAMEEKLRGGGGFLEAEQEKEALRKQFAEGADSFKGYVDEQSAKLAQLGSTVEAEPAVPAETTELPAVAEQVAALAAAHTEAEVARFADLQTASDELLERGVVDNPYTSETVPSLKLLGGGVSAQAADLLELTNAAIAKRDARLGKIAEYEGAARALKAAVDETAARFAANTEPAGATTDDFTAGIKAHAAYKGAEKYELQQQRSTAQQMFGKLKADMPAWEPSAEAAREPLATSWAALEAAEDGVEAALRAKLSEFQRLDALVLTFFDAAGRNGRWLEEQRAVFTGEQYGESAVQCGALLDALGLYAARMALLDDPAALDNQVAAVGAHVRAPEVAEAADAQRAGIATTKGGAAAYEGVLKAALKEYGKLGMLLSPEAFQKRWAELFLSEDLGATSLANAQMLESFGSGYEGELPNHERVIDTIKREAMLRKASIRASLPPADAEGGAAAPPAAPTPSGLLAKHVGVAAKLSSLEEDFDALAEAAKAYKGRLEARQGELQNLVGEVREFAENGTEWLFAVDSVEEGLATPLFADAPEEAQKLFAEFSDETLPALEQLQQQLDELCELAGRLEASPFEEAAGAFHRIKPDELKARLATTKAAADAKKGEFDAFLAKTDEIDALRRRFAEGANAIAKACEATTAEALAAGATKPLEEGIAKMAALRAGRTLPSPEFEALGPLAAELDSAGVVSNSYTDETIQTLLATEEALAKAMLDTEGTLQEQLAAEQSLGLSPEQFREIKEVFDNFDKDGSGTLDKGEFHLCTTGVGLVLTDAEVSETLEKLDKSGDGLISFDEFVTFMVEQLATTGGSSKEAITSAWQALAMSALPTVGEDGQTLAPPEEPPLVVPGSFIARCFTEADIREYLLAHMPAGAEDATYTYPPFVDQEFTR